MNREKSNVLVLSGSELGVRLGDLSGKGEFAHRADAYEALEELSRRPFQTVIVECDYPDLAGLIRAIRRLQKSAAIYGLCSPAGEAQLLISNHHGLDDYFVYPPSVEEVERMFKPAHAVKVPRSAPETSTDLSLGDIAGAIECSDSVESLAGRLKDNVGQWLGVEVAWQDATEDDRPGEPLLLLDGDPPRVLLAGPEAGEVPPAARKKLHSLQALLPALTAVARRTEGLHRLAITDHLTGAYNRRYFYHFTDQLLTRAKAERFRATLLLFDIDDFKQYNDTRGHAAGDEILREIAALMRQVTRKHDIVARIGGDEFAVLFWDAEPPRRPDSNHPQSAYALAGRFMRALESHEFSALGPAGTGTLTISGGLATFPWDGATCRELLRHADASLRQAKTSGKNAIYLVGQDGRQEAIESIADDQAEGAEPETPDPEVIERPAPTNRPRSKP
jgi:diguanylate cyclase (GGDEF)-like protein